MTNRALDVLESFGVSREQIIARHRANDWGNISEEEKEQNRIALEHGGPILSSYEVASNGMGILWVVTAADRSQTVIFTPAEMWRYASLVLG